MTFLAEVRDISLGNDVVQILEVPVNASVHVQPADVQSDVAYILCQAHTQTGHVTLSTEVSSIMELLKVKNIMSMRW